MIPPDASGAARSHPHILYADAEAGACRLVREALSTHCALTFAASGAEAIAAAAAAHPDLILIDAMLAQLDGIDVLSALRADEHTCTTPVLLLTSRAAMEGAVSTADSGVDDYLVKPFSARELLARVRVHLRLADSHLQLAAGTLSHSAMLGSLDQQQQAQLELRRREHELADFFEHAAVGLHWVGPDGLILRVNRSELELLGYTREEYIGRHLTEFLVDQDAAHDILHCLDNGQELNNHPARLHRKDGAILNVLISANVLRQDGRIIHTRYCTLDVTERKAAEGERDRLFNSSVDPICVAGMDGYFKQLNPAWTKVLGHTTEELMSRPWVDFVHPDDRQASIEAKATIEGQEVVLNFENRYLHQDGSYRWLQWKATPQPDGERVFAVARDITDSKLVTEELRQSQLKLERLIHTVDGVFYEADAQNLQFTFVSEQAERMLGFPCTSWLTEPGFWAEHLHPDDRAAAIDNYTQATARMAAYQLEYRMLTADGGVVWVKDIVTVIAKDGKPERLLGIMVDITAQKLAETERSRLEAQLRQAQKMEAIGTLAGGIAHDFNNLLSVVLGNAELAQRDLATAHPALESITEVRRAGQRAKELVQRLLTFSRPQETQHKLMLLQPVLEESVQLLRSTIPAGVEIVFQQTPALPAVKADASQIHQIILNLVTNAWQSLEGRPGRIEVRSETTRVDSTLSRSHPELRPGPHVRLSIGDTGKGMEAATLDRIFEPFFTTKTQGKGTGLGLSIVHSIVRAHGGAILVESQPSRGTIFHVYFPAGQGSVPAIPAATTPIADVRGNGEHILILDDEAPLVFLATRVLERLGYRVTGHTHAQAAVAAFEANPQDFDLVITDFNMPGMSGIDVAMKLLRMQPDLPVVLVSGYLNAAEVQRAYDQGVGEVILKPSAMEDLGPAVKRLLEAHQPLRSRFGHTP